MMEETTSRIYKGILQFSILVFTVALAWFAFIYYPRIINEYRAGRIPAKQLVTTVSAKANKFPIETENYRLVFEDKSGTYYAFINGKTLEEYLNNKNGASLTLKSILSLDSLCGLNIIFASTTKLNVPEQYKGTGC